MTWSVALLLASAASVHAAQVDVQIEGLDEEMRDAARATLKLAGYEKRDISPAELRAAYRDADEEIRNALEAFGFYDVQVDKKLSGDADKGWKAQFTVTPGKPAIVRGERVEVRGEGRQQRRVAEAVAGFAPKVGDRLDHATYEASKQVIDSSLRGAGFLDAKYLQRRVTVKPEQDSADINLVWDSGPRYRFGQVRFSGDAPFPDKFLQEFVPWRPGDYFNSERVLNLQQRLADADYFQLVSVQPALDEKKDGAVPIDVLLNRDERMVYSGEVYYSTDFGAGVRLGVERRWLNKKGHKADAQIDYSQRLEQYALHYQIPRPSRNDRSYDYGAAYRDETTDTSRSRSFQLAASRSEKRWHGFTRTLGFKFLRGDFEIGQDEDNLEFGHSKLLFAEGTLSRRRLNDRLAPRRGYVLDFGVRLASDAIISDTDIAQAWGRLTWLLPQGERSRFKFRAEAGAMAVGDFNALPPDLRFYAGGDRSIRGFDYHAIGETSAQGNIIGGKYLALGSAEYEHYFTEQWGAAIFSDAGDAFSNDFNLNVSVGVGVRWRSPLGPVRVDFAVPVKTELEKSWRVHVLLGPDI
ncbi:MAG TPA: autotransporter assembly complex family protein [Steroidobacteraceae bacterium]|nr:autotransporter assembly complex family protein [Steroidobacteraceae bacterium]